jgi:Polyketide cyclase / dehydrase and lipid transport
MPEIRAAASAVVPAPPAIVYGILADYERGHPAILPAAYFRSFEVLSGGTGAGTRIRFQMRSFGATRTFQARVIEPVPGRELLETDEASGIATRFVVEPADEGRGSRVTIETSYSKRGLGGWIERLAAPGFLRSVYRAELEQLAARAAEATGRRA